MFTWFTRQQQQQKQTQQQDDVLEKGNDIWPPRVGEFVYGLFDDGVFPCEVAGLIGDSLDLNILVPTTVPNMKEESLWKRPSISTNSRYTLHRSSVLPLYPFIIINKYSTHRIVIYECLNYDIAIKFFE
jgi:hypothetical protein